MNEEIIRYKMALANAIAQQGRRREAREVAEETLRSAEERGQPEVQIEALLALSSIAQMGGELQAAEADLLRAKALAPDDQPLIKAHVNHALGRLAFVRSHYDEALQYATEAYRVYEAHLLRTKIAESLHLSAMSLSRLHRYAEAAVDYEGARQQFRGIHHQQGLAAVNVNEAAMSVRTGRFEKAITLSEEAHTLFIDLGDEQGQVVASLNHGTALMWSENVDAADFWYRKALDRATVNAFEFQQAAALVNLGTVRLEQQSVSEALNLLRQGLALRQKLGHAEAVSDATCLAIACARDGDLAEADKQSGWAVKQLKAPDATGVEYNQRVHLVRAQILRLLGGRDQEVEIALGDAKDALDKALKRLPDEEEKELYKNSFPFNRVLVQIIECGQWPERPSIL